MDNNDEENSSQISSGSTAIEEEEERNELAIEDDDKINLGGPSCASRRVIKLDMSKLLAFDEVRIYLYYCRKEINIQLHNTNIYQICAWICISNFKSTELSINIMCSFI